MRHFIYAHILELVETKAYVRILDPQKPNLVRLPSTGNSFGSGDSVCKMFAKIGLEVWLKIANDLYLAISVTEKGWCLLSFGPLALSLKTS